MSHCRPAPAALCDRPDRRRVFRSAVGPLVGANSRSRREPLVARAGPRRPRHCLFPGLSPPALRAPLRPAATSEPASSGASGPGGFPRRSAPVSGSTCTRQGIPVSSISTTSTGRSSSHSFAITRTSTSPSDRRSVHPIGPGNWSGREARLTPVGSSNSGARRCSSRSSSPPPAPRSTTVPDCALASYRRHRSGEQRRGTHRCSEMVTGPFAPVEAVGTIESVLGCFPPGWPRHGATVGELGLLA